MAATTTSSSNCSNFFHTGGNNVEASRGRGAPSHQGCAKVDGVALWLMNGVANAFFASLQRCSCIRIATVDDHEEDSNDLPLIFNDGNLRHHDGTGNTTTTWRKTNKPGKGRVTLLRNKYNKSTTTI
ncbi:unnamed protein product [Lactuca virosa]|uniref:Uncharacterized protein n=1 Tax=Lactuca virosa TaxID=75947 RepID=A0AAU9N9V5_9ASTR|nr:unnamed protein product [Lactuca virosa]CAH1443395.1 unnamed protein product [Lactuca virosa]